MVIYLTPSEFQAALTSGQFHQDYVVAPSFFPGDKAIVHDESAMPCQKKVMRATCTGIYAPGEGPAHLRWRVTFNCTELQ
jgi:hypothetical protein